MLIDFFLNGEAFFNVTHQKLTLGAVGNEFSTV